MSYALTTIWFERYRFFPAVLAVAFSAILIAAQTGLVIGLLAMTSLAVDKSTADIWVSYPGVRSVYLGMPIPEYWASRVLAQPEVKQKLGVLGFEAIGSTTAEFASYIDDESAKYGQIIRDAKIKAE